MQPQVFLKPAESEPAWLLFLPSTMSNFCFAPWKANYSKPSQGAVFSTSWTFIILPEIALHLS